MTLAAARGATAAPTLRRPTGLKTPSSSATTTTAIYELAEEVVARRIDIFDVKLAPMVVAFASSTAAADARCVAEFVVLASTLVELKTRRLLPDESTDDLEDDLAAYLSRDIALARSIERRTFAVAAQRLAHLTEIAGRHHARAEPGADEAERQVTLVTEAQPDPLSTVSGEQLFAALVAALTPLPTVELSVAHITPIRVTVEDCVQRLLRDLPALAPLNFTQLVAGVSDPLEAVAHFLALLELFRLGSVGLHQPRRFGDIAITWHGENAASGATALEVSASEQAVQPNQTVVGSRAA